VKVARGKPAPDLFLFAAPQQGHEPASCVVVEDSPSGVEAARAAGMRVIGFAGLTPRHYLRDADEVVDDMSDLVAAVERLTSSS
jgi:beta-phosphoglucomutase-like phosphatase (HAD superfamily)